MINFAGVNFKGLFKEQILNSVNDYFLLITVNAEIIVLINNDAKFKSIASKSICTFDGQVPYLVAKFKNKNKAFEKISGSEFVYDIFSHCEKENKRVFILGGSNEINKQAVEEIKKQYEVSIDGYSPPFSKYPFPEKINNEILNRLSDFSPDILIVCFNALKTNYWAYDNEEFLKKIGVNFTIGAGGTVDMLSGRLPKSPRIISMLCLEGVYRFINEPKLFRLKRILTSLKMFKYI